MRWNSLAFRGFSRSAMMLFYALALPSSVAAPSVALWRVSLQCVQLHFVAQWAFVAGQGAAGVGKAWTKMGLGRACGWP